MNPGLTARLFLFLYLALLTAPCTVPAHAQRQIVSIIPVPLSAVESDGSMQIGNGDVVSYPENDPAARFAAQHFVDLVERTRGITLRVRVHSEKPAAIALIRSLAVTADKKEEGYQLSVGANQVIVKASSDAGIFYGTVTLWQMMTSTSDMGKPVTLHCVQIHDEPQLSWRGIMLDSARHMQSVAFIQHLIDWMSLEKLNVLHWHLTDDQAWRLEIKRYPKLTQIGGWRELASISSSPTQAELRSHRYGGYYTQQEVRKLVSYAAARNVMIVPEIEMPGHASAALAAYPEFGSSDTPLKAPVDGYGIFPSLYNTNDATFTFLENVLTEVMELFPSPYIHIGGDEAIKDQWKSSATVQEQMKRLRINDEDKLQSYFVKRIDTFLTAHHRHTLGWDEILQGGLAPNATVMSWHGVQGGIDAAKQGHDAVLTPVRPLYFNYRQSSTADEAPGRFALNTLADVYAFDPVPATLTPTERAHIIGVQGNLWTEYVRTEDRAEWMLFPRTAALAEISWSSPQTRDWKGFLQRLPAEERRYRALGVNFDPNVFRVESTAKMDVDQDYGMIQLSNQSNSGVIRYTTDGSEVTSASEEYEKPIRIPLPTDLHASTFDGDEITGSTMERHLDEETILRRYSQELKMCSNDPVIAMEPDPSETPGPVVLANYKNPCWVYKAADLKGAYSISASVVSLPYVFKDKSSSPPALGTPLTPTGQLEVHADTCDGKMITFMPLPTSNETARMVELHSILPELNGTHDLCFKIARPTINPLWVLNWVELDRSSRSGAGIQGPTEVR